MKTFAKVLGCLVFLLPFTVFGQANTWPDFRGNMMAVPMSASGSIPSGILYCEPPVTDTAPMVCYFQGADAYEQATGGNQVGGNISECPGIGTRQYTIDNFNNCAGDNVHIIVDGTDITLTEGAQWNRGASNNDACISLAAGVEASAVGGQVYAYCPGGGAIVYIQPDIHVCWIDLTESDATCTTLTEGNDGQIIISPGTDARPSLTFVGDTNTGIFRNGANAIGITTDGSQRLIISTNEATWLSTITLHELRGLVRNDVAVLNLGTAAATGHGLAAGDVLNGGKLEVDGVSYFDYEIYMGTNFIYGLAAASDSSILVRNPNQTAIAGMMSTGTTGNYWYIAEYADRTYNFAHPQQTNPTLFGQSANQSTTEWWGLTHNQTDAVYSSGAGSIKLSPATGAVGLGTIINAVPAEPFACAAGKDGYTVYVDDSNDTAWARVCICANLDGTGYDWRDFGDIVGTACPFF